MLPRLEAEAELKQINVQTASFGGMNRRDRARYVGRLERLANGERRAAQASPAMLGMMGIAVVQVPAPEPAKEAGNG